MATESLNDRHCSSFYHIITLEVGSLIKLPREGERNIFCLTHEVAFSKMFIATLICLSVQDGLT